MKGRRVRTIRELQQAVEDRRSIIGAKGSWPTHRPLPAAVMINQQGWFLLSLFDKGLFIYEKDGPIIDAECKPKEKEQNHEQ